MKYLLIMNKERLPYVKRMKPALALDLNQNLSKIYVLKEYLKFLWKCAAIEDAGWWLDYWCKLANESKIKLAIKFADKLQKHKQGIINHCIFQIDTGKL